MNTTLHLRHEGAGQTGHQAFYLTLDLHLADTFFMVQRTAVLSYWVASVEIPKTKKLVSDVYMAVVVEENNLLLHLHAILDNKVQGS